MSDRTPYIWRELQKAPPTAWFGFVVVASYIAIAVLADVIAPFGERDVVGGQYEVWSAQFLLGTDNLGRDMLSRLIYGARNTIFLALVTTLLSFLLGGLTGLLAATLGGRVDMVLSRIVDVLLAIPYLIFAAAAADDPRPVLPEPDLGDRGHRQHPCVPPGPRGRDECGGDGICRSGAAARRGAVVDHHGARSCPTSPLRWSRNSACGSASSF